MGNILGSICHARHAMTKLPPFVHRSRGRFRASISVDGKRVYGPRRDTPREAYEDAMRMRDAAPAAQIGLTLGEGCDLVLEEARSKRTAGTVSWYCDRFAALKRALGATQLLATITPATVEQHVRDRRQDVSPATVNAELRALHRVFALAIRRGLVRDNPVKLVDRLRADRPAIHFFEAESFSALLEKVTDQFAADLFVAFAYTGLRRSEMSRVQPEDVQASHVVVRGKNATRIVPVAADAAEAFGRLPFPLDLKQIDDAFRTWKKALKDPRLHPHALRHTFATQLVRAGKRPDVVMRLMGHKDLKTTLRYWHEHGDEARDAVAALRLRRVGSPRPAEG